MPAWSPPRTWIAGEIPTADTFNTHVRDNLLALKDPPTASYSAYAIDYITTSTSWVDIDATNLNFVVATNGGRLMINVHIMSFHNAQSGALDVLVDGVSIGNATYGIFAYGITGTIEQGRTCLTDVLPAGNHTVKLRYRVTGGSQTKINSLACWIREVS
jgi:hypothetical protein